MDGEIELVKTEEERDGWVFCWQSSQAAKGGGRQREAGTRPACLPHNRLWGLLKKNRPFLRGPLHQSPSTWQTGALWRRQCHSGPFVTHGWPFAFTVSRLLLCLFLFLLQWFPKFSRRLPATLRLLGLNFDIYELSKQGFKIPIKKKQSYLTKVRLSIQNFGNISSPLNFWKHSYF